MSKVSKKILITGGTGFLGKALALELKKLGHDVTVTARGKQNSAFLEIAGIYFIRVDICDFEKLVKAFRDQDIVIHCAALASPFGKYSDFYNINFLGTQNVVNACIFNKVERLINLSTPSLYFNNSNRVNIKESEPLPQQQFSYYGQTKKLADEYIQKIHEQGILEIISLRPRAIIGPGDQNIIPRILNARLLGRTPLINGGKAVHDFTFVDNVVDAVILCLDAPHTSLGKFYNITNGEPMDLKSLFSKVLKASKGKATFICVPYFILNMVASVLETIYKLFQVKGEPSLTKYSVGLFAHSQSLDISAAKKELGYVPRVSLDEGIQKIFTQKD